VGKLKKEALLILGNKIFITGANGYLARNIIRKATNKTFVVHSKTKLKYDAENIAARYNGTLTDLDLLDICASSDMLMHFAWEGVREVASLHHINEHYIEQLKFLPKSLEAGFKKILIAGSCFEFGSGTFGMVSENTATNPNTAYGLAKDNLRKQIMALSDNQKIYWTRFIYLYGNDVNSGTFFHQLDKAISDGKGYFNMSGGEQLIDYLHVDLAVEKILKLVNGDYDKGIYHISSGKPKSLLNHAKEYIFAKRSNIELRTGIYKYNELEPFALWSKPSI
jgi:dTDP-6-deoxy-L-talose 4-dehydrogenase (NAD+)